MQPSRYGDKYTHKTITKIQAINTFIVSKTSPQDLFNFIIFITLDMSSNLSKYF